MLCRIIRFMGEHHAALALAWFVLLQGAALCDVHLGAALDDDAAAAAAAGGLHLHLDVA